MAFIEKFLTSTKIPSNWWISQNLDLNTSVQLISLVEFNKWILRAFEFIHNLKLEIYFYRNFKDGITKFCKRSE